MTAVQRGRTWLITGCSSGLGRELAAAALEAGDRVMVTARRQHDLEDLLKLGGDRARSARLDVTDQNEIEAVVQATLDSFGAIDVLVNNAGYGVVGAIEEISVPELRALLDVMLLGAVQLTKAVLPHMRAQRCGTIIQMSSQGGQMSPPGFGGYCAAKFALEAVSEALAAEVAAFGIRVLLVEPGSFRTSFHKQVRLAPEIDAYRNIIGPVRERVAREDGTQPGDPAKAASVILQVLDSHDPPLRLALGKDAVENIRAHHRQVRADLDEWVHLSLSTDHGANS